MENVGLFVFNNVGQGSSGVTAVTSEQCQIRNRGEISPMGEILGIQGGGGGMRAFENSCLFKTGDTKWFP